MGFQRATLLLYYLLVFQFSKSQEKLLIPKRIYDTKLISAHESPTIDGIIDEKSWDIVEWSSDFLEREPDENTAPTEQTQFKIIYDKKFLYIAFRCFDKEPSKIVKRMSRRDGFEGDWVEINIDSYHDKRTGFSFTSSVSGVKGDEFISNNGNNWDGSWNPIWYLETHIDAEGWTAEVKIPFSQLKFGNDKEQVWGIQVQRRFFRAEERSTWQRIPLDSPGWVSEFGELHGLKDIEPQQQIEIQPYSASQLNSYPEEKGNPFRDGNDTKLSAGLDAKIGITNDLTLDLTVNPDFGQVDADPAAIALDGFQIFFEERRPFFVENKNIFDFRFADNPDNLFYSRRIGRSPQGSVSLSENEYANLPKYSTIIGAAKFSGKTKTGWSLGILESVTDNEYAEIDNNGSRREQKVEPLTHYFVGRAQKDFNNRNSFIGGIFTATNRNLTGDDLSYLRKAAYTGGIDFQHNWKNRKYYAIGNVVASHVAGSREAITRTQYSLTHLFQRVDARHVEVDTMRTSLTGTGGRVEIGKSSVGHWRYYTAVLWRSPELELNDVGFLRQADEVRQYASISHQTLKPFGYFRRISTRFEQFSSFDFEGNYNRMQYSINSNANLKSNWNFNSQVVYKPRIYTNTVLQGGPRFRYSEEVFKYINFNSDGRKKFSFYGGIYHSQGKNDSFSYLEYDGGVAYQPINSLTISLSPNYAINKSKTQYVTETDFNGEPRYITAELSQHTLSTTMRIDYSINPNLTIQYYGQPFISRGTYKSFNKVIDPIAHYYGDRIALFEPTQINFAENNNTYEVDENLDGTKDYSFDNPDFSQVSFNSNLVIRWEYIPGSELFLVWSQGLFGNANTRDNLFSGINDQLFNRQPENIFLIKATYRFVL